VWIVFDENELLAVEEMSNASIAEQFESHNFLFEGHDDND
jgi:hypothetical protein